MRCNTILIILFLTTVYDTSTTSNVVVLNTIHIDIMDYIFPATCTDTEFRQMWQDFEWENKVYVLNQFANQCVIYFVGLYFLGFCEHNVDRSTRLFEAFTEINQHEVSDTREGTIRPMWIHGGQHVCKVSSKSSQTNCRAILQCAFLYRSIFGEDALANLSIEKSLDSADATVTGHIRIRAKSQVKVFCYWNHIS